MLWIPANVPVAKPAKAYPIWPIELYAINLFILFWPMAAKAPSIIEAIERNTTMICHWLITFAKGTYINLIKTDNAAIFGISAKKVVTDVGEPS